MAVYYLSDLFQRFDTFLEVERNLSPVTRKDYSYYLKKFMEYVIRNTGRQPSVDKITPDTIRRYLEHLQMEHNYKSTSIARVISKS